MSMVTGEHLIEDEIRKSAAKILRESAATPVCSLCGKKHIGTTYHGRR